MSGAWLLLFGSVAAFTGTTPRMHITHHSSSTRCVPPCAVAPPLPKAKRAHDLQQKVLDVLPTPLDITAKSSLPSSKTPQTDASDGIWDVTMVWRAGIVVLCAIWATNFVTIKLAYDAVPGLGPAEWSALRFALASGVTFPWLISGLKTHREAIFGGLEIGVWIALGYFGQSIGLLTTTAGKSCFICSLHVVWVALVSGVLAGWKFESRVVLCSLVAVAGVGFLELAGASPPVIGDLWSVAQPLAFGTGYIRLSQLMRKYPDAAVPVSAAKLLVCALASFVWIGWQAFDTSGNIFDIAPLLHLDAILASPVALGSLLWCGLIATAGALALESEAFRYVPATDAALIMSTEPLMAAGLAYFLLQEGFGVTDACGGALIIGACVMNELLASKEEVEKESAETLPLPLVPPNVVRDTESCFQIPSPDDPVNDDREWWVCPGLDPQGTLLQLGAELCREVYYDEEYVVACAF